MGKSNSVIQYHQGRLSQLKRYCKSVEIGLLKLSPVPLDKNRKLQRRNVSI